MNKTIVLTAMFLAAVMMWPNELRAKAEQMAEIFLDSHKNEVTKMQVMKSLLNDRSAVFFRCYQVEISDKLTLRKRKQ